MTTTHSNITALFSDIADKIRFKLGTTSSYVADAFPTAIESIGENWVNRTLTSFPLSSGYSGAIGSYAFCSCSQMSGMVKTNSPVISIYAFYYCSKLTDLSFPSLTTIGSYAFYHCNALTSVNLPLLVNLSSYAFGYCSSVTTINLPEVNYIGSYAFTSAYKLTTVSIPKAHRIYTYGFAFCSSLTTVTLPSCTSLGTYAFRGCLRLVSLYLPGSSICSIAASAVFSSTPIGGYSTTAGQFGKVYVPSSLYNTYIASNYWSLISSRIVSM